jgi:hypothetical protein
MFPDINTGDRGTELDGNVVRIERVYGMDESMVDNLRDPDLRGL